MFKLIAADVDGTLADKGEKLGPKTKACLEEMHKQGILIGIASGRPLDFRTIEKATREYELPFDWDFAIGLNGGDTWNRFDGVVKHNHQLAPETIKEILDFMPLDIANPIVFRSAYDEVLTLRDTWQTEASQRRNNSTMVVTTVEEMMRMPTGKVEFHYEAEDEEKILKIAYAHQNEKYKAVRTFPLTVEFFHPDLDKGSGLREICKELNIDLKDTLGIGDMDNDYELIQTAGIGVCMKNGCDLCKGAADQITDYPCAEDGFGRFFFDHYLNK